MANCQKQRENKMTVWVQKRFWYRWMGKGCRKKASNRSSKCDQTHSFSLRRDNNGI